MSETVLLAESGRTTGSPSARRLRTEDRIPGIVYGHGMDPLSLSVGRRDLRVALSGTAGMNTILDLTIDGKVYPTLVKDIQRHPVKRNVQHIDFIQVDLNEEVHVNVRVRLTGEAKAVDAEGGLVDLTMNVMEVITTPRNIPDEIVVDVSEMDMDTTIRVADIVLPDGVTAAADPEYSVVTILTMRTPVLDAEEEAAAEAALEAGDDAPAADADGGDNSGE